jgi:hypothetical protein
MDKRPLPVSAAETDVLETPAARATSKIVTVAFSIIELAGTFLQNYYTQYIKFRTKDRHQLPEMSAGRVLVFDFAIIN